MQKFLKTIIFVEILLSVFSAGVAIAEPAPMQIKERPLTAKELVHKYAVAYNVSEVQMSKTIACESNWDSTSKGDWSKTKKKWLANGIAQFHEDTFIWLSKEKGETMTYTSTSDQIELMAWAFSKGYKNHWTCYTKFYQHNK